MSRFETVCPCVRPSPKVGLGRSPAPRPKAPLFRASLAPRVASRSPAPGGPPRTAPGRTSESVPLWRPLSLSRVLARRPMPTNHHPPPSRESASARPSPRAARWRCAPGRERRCTAGRLRRSARGRPLLIERGSLEWERVMIACGNVMICAGGVRPGDGASGGVWVGG